MYVLTSLLSGSAKGLWARLQDSFLLTWLRSLQVKLVSSRPREAQSATCQGLVTIPLSLFLLSLSLSLSIEHNQTHPA